MYYDDMYEDDDGFLIDDDGYVNVWIDGSCLGNGRRNARAGYGVFFNYNHFMNESAPVDGRATNNVGEIQAAICAIYTSSNYGIDQLRINTDSRFLCESVWKRMRYWARNGFCKTNGDPLANQEDFMELYDALQENMDIIFVHVAAHSGDEYNDAADQLAREGALQY